MSDTIQDESPWKLRIRYIVLPPIVIAAWALYVFATYMVSNALVSYSGEIVTPFILGALLILFFLLLFVMTTAALEYLKIPYVSKLWADLVAWLDDRLSWLVGHW